ncbi:hypothetical protein HDU78_005707 [Chytriomyces hyalinus]|nr:hypothetical protein HDU78_005707 [Chytriomyces hyalinus]
MDRTTPTLQTLPVELVRNILSYMQPSDAVRLRLLSTFINCVISSKYFARLNLLRFPRPPVSDADFTKEDDDFFHLPSNYQIVYIALFLQNAHHLDWKSRRRLNKAAFPKALGRLPQLMSLNLSDNLIEGPIPVELMDVDTLKLLILSKNLLSATIPVQIFHLVNLKILDLSYNRLEGTIPREIGHCTELRVLALQHNKLTGSIPRDLNNLTQLRILSLFRNDLSGPVPDVSALLFLEQMLLFKNRLSGPIPPSIRRLPCIQLCDLRYNEDLTCMADPDFDLFAEFDGSNGDEHGGTNASSASSGFGWLDSLLGDHGSGASRGSVSELRFPDTNPRDIRTNDGKGGSSSVTSELVGRAPQLPPSQQPVLSRTTPSQLMGLPQNPFIESREPTNLCMPNERFFQAQLFQPPWVSSSLVPPPIIIPSSPTKTAKRATQSAPSSAELDPTVHPLVHPLLTPIDNFHPEVALDLESTFSKLRSPSKKLAPQRVKVNNEIALTRLPHSLERAENRLRYRREAEQQRRKLLKQNFTALQTLIPGTEKLSKTDILDSTVEYIEKLRSDIHTKEVLLKTLEEELAFAGERS